MTHKVTVIIMLLDCAPGIFKGITTRFSEDRIKLIYEKGRKTEATAWWTKFCSKFTGDLAHWMDVNVQLIEE